MNSQELIYRPSILCKMLGISSSTLHRMRHRGEIPTPIKISNRTIGWEKSVIDKWLSDRRKEI